MQKEEKAAELYAIEQRLAQAQRQLLLIESQIAELLTTYAALEELKSLQRGQPGFAALAPGIFVNVNFGKPEPLLVNVGAGTHVKKSIEETKQHVSAQIEKLEEVRKRLLADISALIAKTEHVQGA